MQYKFSEFFFFYVSDKVALLVHVQNEPRLNANFRTCAKVEIKEPKQQSCKTSHKQQKVSKLTSFFYRFT